MYFSFHSISVRFLFHFDLVYITFISSFIFLKKSLIWIIELVRNNLFQ